MSLLQIHDKEFELFISKKELNTIVERLATKMEYLEKDSPIFIVVLNGSFFFATDLLKSLSFDSQVHFIKVKSYQGIKISGEINLLIELNLNIEQSTIVIV